MLRFLVQRLALAIPTLVIASMIIFTLQQLLPGDTATYFGKAPEDEHGCKLKIGFSPAAAKVILVSGPENDCYFGGNFTPEGTYRRTSHTIPQQVVDETGDTLRFAHLPPAALKDSH